MVPEPKLRQEVIQRLKLSPQMYQAIHVLELTLPELRELIEQEFQENPLIEIEDKPKKEELPEEKDETPEEDWSDYFAKENDPNKEESRKKRDYRESLIATPPPTLQEELLHQLRMNNITPDEYLIGETMIGNINDDGYLTVPIDEIAQTLGKDATEVNKVLCIIQDCYPAGICARDIKECLLLQLKRQNKTDSLTFKVIETHLWELETKKYDKICKDLHISMEDLKKVIEEVAVLDPKPGRIISSESPVYVMPDLSLEQDENGNFIVCLNNAFFPAIRISKYYTQLLKDKETPDEAKNYIRNKLSAGEWLIKMINQRQETILKIAQYIVDVQKEFFEKGKGHLKPLILAQVAEKVGVDESTVSRTINGKYIQTHMGIFELKDFFTKAIHKEEGQTMSVDELKFKISSLIEAEDRHHPLTDHDIVDRLMAEGIHVARRTVTKYREELNILASYLRKEKL